MRDEVNDTYTIQVKDEDDSPPIVQNQDEATIVDCQDKPQLGAQAQEDQDDFVYYDEGLDTFDYAQFEKENEELEAERRVMEQQPAQNDALDGDGGITVAHQTADGVSFEDLGAYINNATHGVVQIHPNAGSSSHGNNDNHEDPVRQEEVLRTGEDQATDDRAPIDPSGKHTSQH